MRRVFVGVLGAILVAACATPSTSAATQTADPSSRAESVAEYFQQDETGGERLASECAERKPLACSVLAGAYENGDAINAPDVGRDLAAALKYRIRACELGSGADCDQAGDMFVEGKGTKPNKVAAEKYLRLACEDVNTMTGFACGRLGELLLDDDFLGNYDEAMQLLDRGCQAQQAMCTTKAAYQGTQLVPESSPPSGAVGYLFGASARDAEETCAKQGGRFDTDRHLPSPVCWGPSINALDSKAIYVALDFCKRDSLCAIIVAQQSTASTFFGKYYQLQHKLRDIYGPPSFVVVKTAPDCRKVGEAAACIEGGRATFSSTWSWNNKGTIALSVASSHGEISIVLGYYTGEMSKTIGASGL